MENSMFNIHTPVIDRDLGAMTMGFTPMPYMGAGFMNPYMCTNYLNGTKIFDQPPKDTFESYQKREKKDNWNEAIAFISSWRGVPSSVASL